jgi:hypothetical protein
METVRKNTAATVKPLRSPWSVSMRAIVSALLVFHLGAVYVGPFSMGAMGVTSPLAEALRRIYRPYVELIATQYHGYRFFDEPGPSHLIQYELEFANGRPMVTGIMPDIKNHWPRLRYHRHFMLTEDAFRVFSEVGPAEAPPGLEPDSNAYKTWQEFRAANAAMSQSLLDSYAQHLMSVHGASTARLYGLVRRYPMPEEVIEGVKLDDRRFLTKDLIGTFTTKETSP